MMQTVISLLALILGGLQPLPAAAQSSNGTILGVVTDLSGAMIARAEVVITNKQTGIVTRILTTHSGDFWAPYLPSGTYQVKASREGFKTGLKDTIDLLLGQTLTVDFQLEIGEVSETITVSEAPLNLEAGALNVGTNATEREVRTWPIIINDGTRQLQDFVFRAMPGTQGDAFEGSINGGQFFSHEILIDGISIGRMDANGAGNVDFTPTMDAVSEFRLQTGALSAQYGSTQTGLTSFGLKSGTNDFHGSLFEFHTNSALGTNTWNANRLGLRKEPRLENNFGTTLGGPVIRSRTHFFFSYEGDRYRDNSVSSNITVPLGEYKAGDFSRLFDPAFTGNSQSGSVVGMDALGREIRFGQIYDPATTRLLDNGQWVRDPFPGNIIPRDRYSQVTRKILANHDLPNPLLSAFRLNHPGTAGYPRRDIDNVSLKVDHLFSERHRFHGAVVFNDRRFSTHSSSNMQGVPLPGPATMGLVSHLNPGWIGRVSEDWTIGSTKLNHLSFGYNRFRDNFAPAVFQERDWAEELGLKGVGGATFPRIMFNGNNPTLQGGSLRGQGFTANVVAPTGSSIFQDDFSWLRGTHSFRWGVEHRRYYSNWRGVLTSGNWNFNNAQTAFPQSPNQTGFAYASFLLGAASSSNLSRPFVTPGIRSRSTNLYFQDDWKLSPKLTLNLGVRWDIPQSLKEVANRMSSLDPSLPNPAADGHPGALVFLGSCAGCSGKSGFVGTYYRQWAPRVGLAWRMNNQTVIRTGYGINYSPPLLDGSGFPYLAGFNATQFIRPGSGRFREDVAHYWDNAFPPLPFNLPDTNPSLLNGDDVGYYLPDSNRAPYVQNWHFGVQYELPWKTVVEANYVGNKGARLNDQYSYYLNQVHPSYLSLGDTLLDDIADHPEIPLPYPSFTGTVAQSLRPFPQYLGISSHRSTSSWSNYHALQLTATRRSSHGLSFMAAYTFSKALGTSDSAMQDYGYYQQDLYNRRADYSVASFHFPQDLKLSWIYDLRFGAKGQLREGWASKILGGWTASAIQRYRSGAPLSINASDHNLDSLFNPNIRADVLLPRKQQVVGNPSDGDFQTGAPYLNPAAFASPPKTPGDVPLHLGNAPRYLPNLRGFAFYSEDFSLLKRTPLGSREGTLLEFRVDVLNLFNRIGLCAPATDISDQGSFGRVFSKCGSPRNIQVGVRVNF